MNDEFDDDFCEQQCAPGFLTNFSEQYRPIYLEAVKRYGSNYFVVQDDPEYPMSHGEGGSLLYLGPSKDLSDFWRVFDAVEAEMSKQS